MPKPAVVRSPPRQRATRNHRGYSRSSEKAPTRTSRTSARNSACPSCHPYCNTFASQCSLDSLPICSRLQSGKQKEAHAMLAELGLRTPMLVSTRACSRVRRTLHKARSLGFGFGWRSRGAAVLVHRNRSHFRISG